MSKTKTGPHSSAVKPWRDSRVAARRKARAKTETLLASVLYQAASQNRQDAIARKAPRYIGAPCPKHGTPERYSVSGHCVICSRETRRVARHQTARIASAVPPRPVGVWASTEQPDFVRTPGYRLCTVCHRPIPDDRVRSMTCSPKCARAVRAAKKASTVKNSLTIESAARRPEPVSTPMLHVTRGQSNAPATALGPSGIGPVRP